ncbi:cobalamin-binding protein [Rubrobacter aplysinae]|uniref:cobalamin-binding protein n=1 Tax=Rubrobacter aplysinae TaxID=909625 RepID=UPI00064B8F5C|nr:cobalamin-binding protein [Rubrobacter aplysinae]
MRIASLLPGATEIAALVGAGDDLVGVTHECDHPPGVERLPKLTTTPIDPSRMTSAEIDAAVTSLGSSAGASGALTDEGSIYGLQTDLLAELAPDLVLTQGVCDVCAVSMSVVERGVSDLDPVPRLISLNPSSLSEVLDDVVTVGEAVGRGDDARRERDSLRQRLADVEDRVRGLPRPRVACLEWLDPLFSGGHWVPEMVRAAGGEDALAAPGEPSARISWEHFAQTEPGVVVLMPCGFDAGRAATEARILEEAAGWSRVPAVRENKVWAVDASSYFSRPAPRLVDGVETLARILHPEAFPEGPEGPNERAAIQVTRFSGVRTG